jgi:hypothetical protein
VEGENLLNQWPMITKVNELIPALSIQGLALHSHTGHGCISDFLRHKLLVVLLIMENDFISHSARKTLLVLSNYLVGSVSKWKRKVLAAENRDAIEEP